MMTAEEQKDAEENAGRLDSDIEELKASLEGVPKMSHQWLRIKTDIKNKDTERMLFLEKKRCSEITRQYLDENPDLLGVIPECPICLEKQWDEDNTMLRYICCGKSICTECDKQGGICLDTCPFCRSKNPDVGDEKILTELLEERLKDGKVWAMQEVGVRQIRGIGMEKNIEKGLVLLHRAAERGNVKAIHALGCHFQNEEDFDAAHNYFERAAKSGSIIALGDIGSLCSSGKGCQQDDAKALQYLTIAVTLCEQPRHKSALGTLPFYSTSHVLSHHYLRPEAEEKNAHAMAQYAIVSMGVAWEYYDSETNICGHSPIPEAFFWLSRSRAMGYQDARIDETFNCVLITTRSFCAHCKKKLPYEKPKRCSECCAAYYCCEECQIANWKAGHKKDCIRKLKKRLKNAGKL